MKTIRLTATAALAALLLTVTVAAIPAFAQDKMGGKMGDSKMSGKMDKKMDGKMAAPVYVSKGSKMGYTEAEAKKMGMKDKMGKPLTKMTMLPKGYKMMSSKMDSKMDAGKMDSKMSGSKMSGGKMAPKKP